MTIKHRLKTFELGAFKQCYVVLSLVGIRCVAKNLQSGTVLRVWGRTPQPLEAGGLRAKPPAAGGAGVLRADPQRLKILLFFAKITSFSDYFDKTYCF